jgi:hypothetical protein
MKENEDEAYDDWRSSGEQPDDNRCPCGGNDFTAVHAFPTTLIYTKLS